MMDRQMDRQTDRQTDKRTDSLLSRFPGRDARLIIFTKLLQFHYTNLSDFQDYQAFRWDVFIKHAVGRFHLTGDSYPETADTVQVWKCSSSDPSFITRLVTGLSIF